MAGSIVSCRGLEKSYHSAAREAKVLRGVSLELERGAWVSIMGPSGCGKSTLLHLIGGLDVADAGSVVVDGVDLASLSEARRAILRRSGIGYVFQFFNLVQDLTAAENVELPMLLVGTRRREAHRRAVELLEAVGVAGIEGAAPSELSGGQQQRVAIARALANRPAVLLADEPTGNLDSAAAQQVIDVLRARHADDGQTILMVTHDPSVAAAADTTWHMRDGLFVDTPAGAPRAA